MKTLHSYLSLYLRKLSSSREEEQHQCRTESENLTKSTHQIKKKTWKCFSLLEGRREGEKHPRSSSSCKRAPSSKFRRGQHRSTPHRFPSTAKSYFRWKFIALPRIEASFPAGRDKEKRATLFSRAKDNWRPVSIVPFFFSRANFSLSLSVRKKAHGCASWRLLNVPTASVDLFHGGLWKERNVDIYRPFPALR